MQLFPDRWVLVVLMMVSCFCKAQAQQTLPLSLQNIGGSERLVIYAGIDGSAPLPYLFDTGSSAFNAAYYNGSMQNNATNYSAWSNDGTNVINAHYDYGSASSGFGYLINEVRVTNIAIYYPDSTTVAANLTSFSGFTMGQAIERITNTSTTNPDYTDRYGNKYNFDPFFTDQLSKGKPPEPVSNSFAAGGMGGGLYGTFGAGLFADINSNSPSGVNYTNGSILGQATTTGWAIIANNVGTNLISTNPYAILGLNSFITNQFTTAAHWITNSTNTFPNSGATSGTEFDVNFGYTLSNSNSAIQWTNATLLDSGTQDNTLNASGKTANELINYTNNYKNNGGSIIASNVLSASASDVSGSGTYTFVTTQITNPVTYNSSLNPGGTNSTSTLGIGFFLNNSVAFDLQNQQTLYTPNIVVNSVPEPSTDGLLVLAGIAALLSIRSWRVFFQR